jgi:hypothetical protein
MNLGYGMERLINTHQNYFRAAFPVYLRLRNFDSVQTQDWAALGFSVAPSGRVTGTTDILIAPPPDVMMVSVHNIGQSNGKLRFGARVFLVSQSFVRCQVTEQGLENQNSVWNGPRVVGLVSEGLLFSIENIAHEELGGSSVSWLLTCNASEVR